MVETKKKIKSVLTDTREVKAGSMPEGFVPQEDASFKKFDNIGDSVQGKLLEVSKSERWGFNIYTLRTNSGENIRCHGTQQLDNLMLNAVIGDNIYIEYVDTTETANGNMKIFAVGIAPKGN